MTQRPKGKRTTGTPRTATTEWKAIRKRALRQAQRDGITTCHYCGRTLNYQQGRQPNSAEPDHVIPWARGGTNASSNLRVICRTCNISKGNRDAPKQATINAYRPLKTSRQW